jgi:opacity protein-like surface antigen
MKLWKTMLGAIGAATIATSAMAADLPTIAAPPPPPMAAPAFDWSGRYVGVFTIVPIVPFSPVVVLGGSVGLNMARGNLVFGAALDTFVSVLPGFTIGAQAQGRLGYALGQRALLYGVVGIGFSGVPFWSFGGGAEFAMRETRSLYVEVAQWRALTAGPPPAIMATIGMNFHR